jgi:hypothetical protein
VKERTRMKNISRRKESLRGYQGTAVDVVGKIEGGEREIETGVNACK